MRRYAPVATLFALLGITSLAAYSYHRHAAADEGASLVGALPPGEQFVAYIDTERFRNSQFLGQVLALSPSPVPSVDYQQFVRETGFDFSRDLNRLAIGVRPHGSEASLEAVAEGAFDQDRITAYARQHDGTVRSSKGGRTLSFRSEDGKRTVTLEFVSSSRLRLASVPVDGQGEASLAPTVDPAPMQEHLARVADAAMFAVVHVEALPANVAGSVHLGQYSNATRGIEWLTLEISPKGDNLQVSLRGDCRSAEYAQQLASGLNMLKGFGAALVSQQAAQQKLAAEQASVLGDFINKVDVQQQDTRVTLAFGISTQLLKQLPKPGAPAARSSTGH